MALAERFVSAASVWVLACMLGAYNRCTWQNRNNSANQQQVIGTDKRERVKEFREKQQQQQIPNTVALNYDGVAIECEVSYVIIILIPILLLLYAALGVCVYLYTIDFNRVPYFVVDLPYCVLRYFICTVSLCVVHLIWLPIYIVE